MKRSTPWLIAVPAVVAMLLLLMLLSAGDVGYWRRYLAARLANDTALPLHLYQPRVIIGGGDGGAMPRALPEEQEIEPAALQIADSTAQGEGATALLVSRNGHLIHERYWQGTNAATPTDGGEWTQVVLALTTGAAVGDAQLESGAALATLQTRLDAARPPGDWLNPWSAGAQHLFARSGQPVSLEQLAGRDYAAVLSSLLWKPLNAGEAWLWRDGPATCCMVARLADWLRVAELLLSDGVFEDERIVPTGWVEQILPMVRRPGPAPGPEPFVARSMYHLRGAHGSRLWLLPGQRLAILLLRSRTPDGEADETTLPNSIVRGIVNRTTGSRPAADVHELVPAH